ncbi:succinyl-diaminopimelate desuccinylase [Enhydrobacter sp.]|jgi:succinyl-diaminopimelate desuccinylase|uniref:succinyl-diaminopimelate desuccinylase n=1 Tax=Enhydrobacter sp. TaxID=1894999 RepID=UPI002624A01E|nr:succinyl-diaminopimelate desuccinylase [Enhydrobacter sp.]WIM12010.1 MAG: N-succinyl-L,L-diaminopimelate desuccinylase [Enhydrobacter sp.]
MPDTLAPSVADVVELTRALVRCESVTPREAGALQLLERMLAPLGFRCERMDFSQAGTDDVANLYARIGSGGKHFCFAGHSDVVPVGDLSSWTIGPFAAELSGGYLFGRGASDMKGAIAAFTDAAARFIARRGREFGGSISLLITGDEEGPAVNGTVKMLKRLAERGETIDACVVGEPTCARRFGDMMKIGRRGSMTVDLNVRGVQGHVAYPERLDNPIHRLATLIEALVREPIDRGSTHFQPTSLQFTTVDVGNRATNIAPGVVAARFNTRFNDLWTSKTLLAHLQERIERANAALGGNGIVEYEVEVSGESFYTPPGPLSDLVAGAVRDVAGIDPELSTTGGTSDARFIRAYCPVLEFGLVGESMHKVDEKSAVADLRTLARVYETVLDRYFST